MKLKCLLIAVFCLLMAGPIAADDDVMITRDGSMITVKVEKISSSQVTFIDLKHKKRGRLNAPADFVYMIMKEKGNNIFFDEEGYQTTSPAVKFDKKDNVMFLNRGEMIVIYNVSVGRDEVVYQLKDKKKAPQYKISKDEVFMIRNSDGTTTLYNDSYQKRQKEQQAAAAPTNTALVMPTVSTQQIATSPTSMPAASTSTTTVDSQSTISQQLLASGTAEVNFVPAIGMNGAELEMKVNAINPYILFRKGAVAEYCFQYKGKQTQLEGGPTYVQQIVGEEKIENGLLVAYIRQEYFNKKHEPSKGIPASFRGYYYPVEIDTSGTYHLTHNLLYDIFLINKRQGYGVLIPGNMRPNMQLSNSTLRDKVKHPLFGGNFGIETVYSNWQVVKEEKISTPAGTFDCIKLTGNIEQNKGKGSFSARQKVTCWMARGIGIVQYETVNDSGKDSDPFIMYLNKLDLK